MTGGIKWLVNWLREQMSGESSESITPNNALTYAPVWYAVNRIAGHIAMMPLNVHQERPNGEITKPTSHLGYRLLRNRPNAYQTPFIFKQQMQVHALLWGNGRAFVHRDGLNTELIPLMPDRTATALIDGKKWHATIIERNERLSIWEDMGQNMEKTVVLSDSEVLHVPGLGFDGVEGKSLISLAARSFSIGIGGEKHIGSQQKKGYAGGLMLEAPLGAFRNEGDAKEFLKAFREQHEGSDNAGKVALLREGIKANVMAMSNSDAQFIEQRKFQRQDVALWFLLEQILGDDSSVSYNSLEQKNLAYLQNCLGRWMQVWEQECEAKLLSSAEVARGYYFKFNDGSLLRSDKSATATVISQLITSRVINPNEARKMLDLNPYDGGDEYENPAISPGSGADKPDDEESDSATNNIRQKWLGDLLAVEQNRILDATKSKAFIKRAEEFYSRWEAKLADAIEACGGMRDLATKHCDESKRQLIEACKCETGKLAESVAKCVETWHERLETLTKELDNA
jgi:HK97 family phage portal protein